VAIVVDMHRSPGAVYIHTGADDYLDMVGQDFKGRMVIVPWRPGLKIISIGQCRVGVVRKLEVEAADEAEGAEEAGVGTEASGI